MLSAKLQSFCHSSNELSQHIYIILWRHEWHPYDSTMGKLWTINYDYSSRPDQNGRHFADDTFNRILMNEIFSISIPNSLKFVPKGPIDNKGALVQVMAWRRTGDKPLPEPMLTQFTDAYMQHYGKMS